MSLDTLDTAFVRRLASRSRDVATPVATRPRPARPRSHDEGGRSARPAPAIPPAIPAVGAEVAQRSPEPSCATEPVAARAAPRETREPIVARLLAEAPDQWTALAAHVETARQRGLRVIAVAGGRSGEGRTTLVRCLARILEARGRDVTCTAPHDLAVVAGGIDGRSPTHDKRIILVDAGIWFPPGPIRRSLLQVASLGCEAAILVRRAGTAAGSARQAALESLGIEVLGEVLTFTSPADEVSSGAGDP